MIGEIMGRYIVKNNNEQLIGEAIYEICECRGQARFAYWEIDTQNKWLIPILRCKGCGQEMEAHESNWRKAQ